MTVQSSLYHKPEQLHNTNTCISFNTLCSNNYLHMQSQTCDWCVNNGLFWNMLNCALVFYQFKSHETFYRSLIFNPYKEKRYTCIYTSEITKLPVENDPCNQSTLFSFWRDLFLLNMLNNTWTLTPISESSYYSLYWQMHSILW